mmetsp:Transcript_11775/g.26665  ORF Transcript_11775/g.26665 Transcript_11775/m.26665 type:complete len:402 (+) Transcript_11775:140-1345(+)
MTADLPRTGRSQTSRQQSSKQQRWRLCVSRVELTIAPAGPPKVVTVFKHGCRSHMTEPQELKDGSASWQGSAEASATHLLQWDIEAPMALATDILKVHVFDPQSRRPGHPTYERDMLWLGFFQVPLAPLKPGAGSQVLRGGPFIKADDDLPAAKAGAPQKRGASSGPRRNSYGAGRRVQSGPRQRASSTDMSARKVQEVREAPLLHSSLALTASLESSRSLQSEVSVLSGVTNSVVSEVQAVLNDGCEQKESTASTITPRSGYSTPPSASARSTARPSIKAPLECTPPERMNGKVVHTESLRSHHPKAPREKPPRHPPTAALLRRALSSRFPTLLDALQAFDRNADGLVSYDEFGAAILDSGLLQGAKESNNIILELWKEADIDELDHLSVARLATFLGFG